MGIQGGTNREVESEMEELAQTFRKNAESFYDKDAKASESGISHANIMEFLCMEIPETAQRQSQFAYELRPD